MHLLPTGMWHKFRVIFFGGQVSFPVSMNIIFVMQFCG